mgnify:CR=1 FL=1
MCHSIFTATQTERITHYTLQAKSCAKRGSLPPLDTPIFSVLPLENCTIQFSILDLKMQNRHSLHLPSGCSLCLFRFSCRRFRSARFLLPGCECCYIFAPIPSDRALSVPRKLLRQLSSASQSYPAFLAPARSHLQDMTTVRRIIPARCISLAAFLSEILCAIVRIFLRQFQVRDIIVPYQYIVNSVFCLSLFQFVHVHYLHVLFMASNV